MRNPRGGEVEVEVEVEVEGNVMIYGLLAYTRMCYGFESLRLQCSLAGFDAQ